VGLINNSASTAVPTQAASVDSANRSTSRQIDLPQPGDIFPSEESLYCHTGVALTLTWGFSAIRRLNAASVQYDCTIKGCAFKIKADAVTQVDGMGLTTRWHVKSNSVYNHTHDRREALVLDPSWRPTIRKEEIVKGWKQFDENGRLDDEDQVKRASVSILSIMGPLFVELIESFPQIADFGKESLSIRTGSIGGIARRSNSIGQAVNTSTRTIKIQISSHLILFLRRRFSLFRLLRLT